MGVVIMGAGPAGLSAAYVLAKKGGSPIVLEKSPGVGGISRTVCFKGYYFDLGGHRFFTKFDTMHYDYLFNHHGVINLRRLNICPRADEHPT